MLVSDCDQKFSSELPLIESTSEPSTLFDEAVAAAESTTEVPHEKMTAIAALRHDLKASVGDASAYGLMVGLGETYLPAFALAIGLGDVVSGLIASVPILIGGAIQLISPRMIQWCGSYQRWIVMACSLQAAAFVPLFLAAVQGSINVWWLFALASMYWAGGMSGGPAWNTWIADLVPSRIRPRFFAIRTRWMQLATFGGFLLGGFALFLGSRSQSVLYGFAAIFLIAGLARAVSVWYLVKHDRSRKAGSPREHHRAEARSATRFSPVAARLVIYLVAMQAFVQISGPYFTPYMIKQLKISYPIFVVIIGSCFVAKALSLPLWGMVAKRYGATALLWTGGLSIIPLASLWTISNHVSWLIFVQVLSGITWSAYELAFFLCFLKDIPKDQRARMLTFYNFANGAAWCFGSLIGGYVLYTNSASIAAYHSLFVISSLGRLACVGLLWNIERRTVKRPMPLAPTPSLIERSAA